ncbi:MAG: branched-chain amino acid transport system II carrier protein [Chlamydiales bacterium]|nr:branched-chain amino acid transport system II carrier protein [Chlamydiia bacterium]MCP5507250.1 branched-chain amino acid transport system II carrier protein [Chlamydiales bacterium]
MKKPEKSSVLSTGLAMFAMFFGAGNVVFPLALGQYAQDQNLYAVLGLLLSAICVPFAGLIAMILFNGKYQEFFGRLGRIPGFVVALVIMGLIGPFGAMPRCIALSYSTLSMFTPSISLPLFSAIACLILFAFTVRPSSIIDVLGKYLTPFLLGSLLLIIIKGIATAPGAPVSGHDPVATFMMGLKEGYQTMDLLGAFFFSTVVTTSLHQHLHPKDKSDYKKIVALALKASAIGAFLLAGIYIGFSYVAAMTSASLTHVPKDQILGSIALEVMGPYAGIVTSIAVALACLTTAIALANVFAEFIHADISKGKIKYPYALIGTIVATYFVSTLNFTGIVAALAPILSVGYPALIVLSLLNIMYKLYKFEPVKIPVLFVFMFSLGETFLG